MSVWAGKTDKRPCPGNPPPSTRKYDQCGGEAFEICALTVCDFKLLSQLETLVEF